VCVKVGVNEEIALRQPSEVLSLLTRRSIGLCHGDMEGIRIRPRRALTCRIEVLAQDCYQYSGGPSGGSGEQSGGECDKLCGMV